MKLASLTQNIEYKENGPAIDILLETETTKEIRIVMRKGQHMKEHKAPSPIVVELFEGKIDFGVNKVIHSFNKGDMITLDANVPHDLNCVEDCIVRLSLMKTDTIERVKDIIKQ